MYRFVERYKKAWPIVLMCKVLKLSVNTYYAWRKRPESVRKRENESLIAVVQSIHVKMRQCYGTRRMAKELQAWYRLRTLQSKNLDAPSQCTGSYQETLCEHHR